MSEYTRDSRFSLVKAPALPPVKEEKRRERTTLDILVTKLEGFLLRLIEPWYKNKTKRVVQCSDSFRQDIALMSDNELRQSTREAGTILRRSSKLDVDQTARFLALLGEVSVRTLGLMPHPVQLEGIKVLLDGRLLEMATGEGKTLVAGLAAAASALCGKPAHVVTVNDYLVARDAEYIKPVMDYLDLSLGVVVKESTLEERIEAYACSVCYCTNNELAFDYLKDSLQAHASGRLAGDVFSKYFRSHARRIKELAFAIVDEADSVMIDEARTPLILSEGVDGGISQDEIARLMAYAKGLQTGIDFTIDPLKWQISLKEACKARVDRDFSDVEKGPLQIRALREELLVKALSAEHLYNKNEHYLVREEKIEIIDEYTGRSMPERVWSAGLHQMIEFKENCPLTEPRLTAARITYQRFFRRYKSLSGLSGTVSEVGAEFWNVYGLEIYRVATHKPSKRKLLPDRVFPSREEKWSSVVKRAKELNAAGAPILIGVRSVAAAEELSQHLMKAGLEFHTLHAANDKDEADVVKSAGQRGRITIATNMAGRGTDIPLGGGVESLGGLHVIMTERHDSGRIDRQLMGRCARQGNPGCFEVFQSLDDPLAQIVRPRALTNLARLGLKSNFHGFARYILLRSQKRVEKQHSKVRESLLKSDHSEGDLLAFSGEPE